jgi:archaellum component FlaC
LHPLRRREKLSPLALYLFLTGLILFAAAFALIVLEIILSAPPSFLEAGIWGLLGAGAAFIFAGFVEQRFHQVFMMLETVIDQGYSAETIQRRIDELEGRVTDLARLGESSSEHLRKLQSVLEEIRDQSHSLTGALEYAQTENRRLREDQSDSSTRMTSMENQIDSNSRRLVEVGDKLDSIKNELDRINDKLNLH